MNKFVYSKKRAAIHPGYFIQKYILDEYGLSQTELAKRLKVARQTVNEMVHQKQGVTIKMARKLGKLTDTEPEFWINLQVQGTLDEIPQQSFKHVEVEPLVPCRCEICLYTENPTLFELSRLGQYVKAQAYEIKCERTIPLPKKPPWPPHPLHCPRKSGSCGGPNSQLFSLCCWP